MVKVYFVRHGETVLNVECRLAGQIETELTENGKKQADETGKKLFEMGVRPDMILEDLKTIFSSCRSSNTYEFNYFIEL